MKKRCISFIRKSTIAVFCTFTAFSHCLFGYASNDDEYITFESAETMQAYRYFYMYGLRADSSYTYTDTYTTTGSVSENATISLSSSGGSFSGSSTSASDIIGQWRDGNSATTLSLSIPNDKVVAQLDPTSTTPSHLTLACTYNTPTDLAPAPSDYDYEYTKMSCSDSSFVDVSRYTVTLKPVNSGVYITGFTENTPTYLKSMDDPLYDSENNSSLRILGANSFSGNLSLSENGSFNGTGTVSLTTTTTNTNNLKYVLPFMAQKEKLHPTSNLVCFYNYNDDPFILAYFSNTGRNNNLIRLIDKNTNEEVNFNDYVKLQVKINSGLILYYLETKAGWFENHSLYYDFDDNYFIGGYSHIPLYVGYKSRMSDSVYRYLYGQDRIEQAIKDLKVITQNGTIESQDKGQELDTKTNQMSNKMTEFQNIEDTAGDNMNNALNNINTNPSLLSNNKFLMSADWIRQQFNRIVSNTPFEAVITFCLVFGLGLLLLGKVR